ncbi:MAG: regulatory protein [Chloroflexota bacterium]|jgi:regulatory protein|nr:regulatory protein [Chloroflexota bacterium]
MTAGRRAPRESYAERRARRAAIDDPEVVLAAAYRFLEARARSVTETRRRLSDAGYRAELIDGAIARLLGIGLLDDEAFARHWIESRDRARPRGEIALTRELRLRGVEPSVIAAALEERRQVESDDPFGTAGTSDAEAGTERVEPDEAAAARLLERRRRDLERVTDPRKRRARAYALLARSGFGPEIAARLAAGFMTAAAGDPPEE